MKNWKDFKLRKEEERTEVSKEHFEIYLFIRIDSIEMGNVKAKKRTFEIKGSYYKENSG